MIDQDLLCRYPRVRRLLEQHPGWTLDDALKFTEQLLKDQGLG